MLLEPSLSEHYRPSGIEAEPESGHSVWRGELTEN